MIGFFDGAFGDGSEAFIDYALEQTAGELQREFSNIIEHMMKIEGDAFKALGDVVVHFGELMKILNNFSNIVDMIPKKVTKKLSDLYDTLVEDYAEVLTQVSSRAMNKGLILLAELTQVKNHWENEHYEKAGRVVGQVFNDLLL